MKKAHFLIRAIVCFIVFVMIGLGLHRFSNHHYKNIADWSEPDDTNVLIYQDKTYYYAGKIGDPGLAAKKFAKNETLGEVTPDSLWDKKEAFVVWSVEGKANFLIVTVGESTQYLYYHESVSNPAETETAMG